MITRVWAMPNSDTFSCAPIGRFVRKYLCGVSVDPFARNCDWATLRNDMNPETRATYHMDAREFLAGLEVESVDVVLFDPPYSPRQIAECYQSIGKRPTTEDTQNARLYAECRREFERIVKPGGMVLSFGWNSCGMGSKWERVETLLVAHGGAHNDTICVADRKPL